MATPATIAIAMPVKEGNSLLHVIRTIILQNEFIENVRKMFSWVLRYLVINKAGTVSIKKFLP